MRKPSAYIIFALFTLCLAACGGRHSPVLPSNLAQFQLVQNARTATGDTASSPGTTVYKLGDAGPNAYIVEDMRIGADGKMYYTTAPSADPEAARGELGSFDFTTHKQVYQELSYGPGYVEETTHGVWVEEAENASGHPTIDRYTGVGGSDK